MNQLTMQDLGLPEDALELSNAVITKVTHTSPRLSTTITGDVKISFAKNSPGFTAYGLNFLHSYVHEMDFKFIGLENNTLKFYKNPIEFTLNGVTHKISAQELHIYIDSNNHWVFKVKTYAESYKILFRRKFTDFTAEQLAVMANITVDELYERLSSYYYGEDRNPDTHITNVFVKVNKTEDDVFTGQTYLNLNPITSGYGRYITSYNTSGASYVVRWKLYNGCTAETAISGGYEKGNFGLCELRQSGAYTEVNPQKFNWDTTKEYITVECQIEELPAQGKNFTTSGYWVVQGCDSDDPCGSAQRLPRKPVQS